MEKCIAIIKTGPRKGKECGAVKKVIDFIDGKEIPHCNRHRIKEDKDINILSENLNNNLKIGESIIEEDNNTNNHNPQNILNDIDRQLDKLFSEYGL